MTTASAIPDSHLAWKTGLKGGFIAGLLDILAAGIQYYMNTGKGPLPVFRFIASGLFGKSAFAGGTAMALYGLLFHFCIAIFFACVYVAVYRQFKLLHGNPVLAGVLYGTIIWLVMNKVVLPLSNAPTIPFKLEKAVVAWLILVAMVGIPIAVITKYAHRRYVK